MADKHGPPFGCWWIDEKTGEKVPGISPRNQEQKKPKPAKPAKAEEK